MGYKGNFHVHHCVLHSSLCPDCPWRTSVHFQMCALYSLSQFPKVGIVNILLKLHSIYYRCFHLSVHENHHKLREWFWFSVTCKLKLYASDLKWGSIWLCFSPTHSYCIRLFWVSLFPLWWFLLQGSVVTELTDTPSSCIPATVHFLKTQIHSVGQSQWMQQPAKHICAEKRLGSAHSFLQILKAWQAHP